MVDGRGTVFADFVHYDAETAKPTNDIAQSIETTDNQNFTVKLKPGYKFQDGTVVTSKSFVDAWNYAAYGPNAQSSGYFVESRSRASATSSAPAPPTPTTRAGLHPEGQGDAPA